MWTFKIWILFQPALSICPWQYSRHPPNIISLDYCCITFYHSTKDVLMSLSTHRDMFSGGPRSNQYQQTLIAKFNFLCRLVEYSIAQCLQSNFFSYSYLSQSVLITCCSDHDCLESISNNGGQKPRNTSTGHLVYNLI